MALPDFATYFVAVVKRAHFSQWTFFSPEIRMNVCFLQKNIKHDHMSMDATNSHKCGSVAKHPKMQSCDPKGWDSHRTFKRVVSLSGEVCCNSEQSEVENHG